MVAQRCCARPFPPSTPRRRPVFPHGTPVRCGPMSPRVARCLWAGLAMPGAVLADLVLDAGPAAAHNVSAGSLPAPVLAPRVRRRLRRRGHRHRPAQQLAEAAPAHRRGGAGRGPSPTPPRRTARALAGAGGPRHRAGPARLDPVRRVRRPEHRRRQHRPGHRLRDLGGGAPDGVPRWPATSCGPSTRTCRSWRWPSASTAGEPTGPCLRTAPRTPRPGPRPRSSWVFSWFYLAYYSPGSPRAMAVLLVVYSAAAVAGRPSLGPGLAGVGRGVRRRSPGRSPSSCRRRGRAAPSGPPRPRRGVGRRRRRSTPCRPRRSGSTWRGPTAGWGRTLVNTIGLAVAHRCRRRRSSCSPLRVVDARTSRSARRRR